MKVYLLIFGVCAAGFGVPMGILGGAVIGYTFGLEEGLKKGGLVCLLGGGFVGLAMLVCCLILHRKVKRFRGALAGEVVGNENILFEGEASRLLGRRLSVGGWMFLTRQSLRFKSHGLEPQSHAENILLSAIERVDEKKMLGIFPTGLILHTGAGGLITFIVFEPEKWREQIERAQSLTTGDRSALDQQCPDQ